MIAGKIIKQNITLKQKLRRLLLWQSRKNGARKSWESRHSIVFDQHPGYRVNLSSGTEKKHRKKWEIFRIRKKVPLSTLQICTAISGIEDPEIIPEEIFQADLEPTLNGFPEAHFQGVKHFYSKRHPGAGFPHCYLHKIDGVWFDADLNPLTDKARKNRLSRLQFPLIVKPGVDSYGGSGVTIVENQESLAGITREREDVVVQVKMEQAPELAAYHPASLNTVRVYLYRSVRDNKIHIINRALRTGNGNAVDNVSAGGLVSMIRDEGCLNGFALDRYGQKFSRHPVTGVRFDKTIPGFEEMNQLAMNVARQLHLLRVVGLDLFYDKNETWRPLEINTRGHSIRFAQYAGRPFFGEFTGEVIEYCKENHWALTV